MREIPIPYYAAKYCKFAKLGRVEIMLNKSLSVYKLNMENVQIPVE